MSNDVERNATDASELDNRNVVGLDVVTLNQLSKPDLIADIEACRCNCDNDEKQLHVKNIPELTTTNINLTVDSRDRCDVTPSTDDDRISAERCTETRVRTRQRWKNVRKTFRRAACCMGWVFLCPCWTLGVCLREPPESVDDLRDDPCWPCFTNSSNSQSPVK